MQWLCWLESNKQACWLQGIQLAHESQTKATSSHQQQQQLMTEFFHMIDEYHCISNELHA
jgi:hypothetical protein